MSSEGATGMEMEMAVDAGQVASDQGSRPELLLQLMAASDQHSSTADHPAAFLSRRALPEAVSAALPAGGSTCVEGRPVDAVVGGGGAAYVDVSLLQQVIAGRRERQLRGLVESIPHRMKLQQLYKAESQIRKEGAAHKTACRGLSKELYQMLSWYAVLVSAIYAGVAQTSVLTCRLQWGPISITVLVAAAIWWGVRERLLGISDHKQNAAISQTRQNAIYDMIAEMLQRGAACNLDRLQPQHNQESPGLATHSTSWCCLQQIWQFSPLAIITLLFFLGICGITIASFYFMLCVPGCVCPPP